jgi:hypothetical protein
MSTAQSSSRPRLIDARPEARLDRAHAFDADHRAAAAGRRTVIPWGVVGTIGLIVVIECFVARNWLDFTDPVSLSWRYSAAAVESESPGSELLCLGDSLIKHGLLPGVIERGTGRRTVNLSAARAPTLLTYFFLRRALDAGARPRAIIINAKPAVLLAGPEFNARYWQEVLTPRECLEFSLMTRNGPFMLATIAGRLLPSIRSRLEVQSHVLAAVRGEPDCIPAINRVLLRNWTVNRGANVAAVHSDRPDEAEPDIERKLHPGLFFVDPTNVQGIDRLLQLAAARDIPVFWLLTPLSPVLQTLRDQSGAEVAYEQFVRAFLLRYPRLLTVLDARRGAYPSSLFADHTHLNVQGALALSHAVATTLKPLLARPRSASGPVWLAVARPTERTAASGVIVEDLEQSRNHLPGDGASYSASP